MSDAFDLILGVYRSPARASLLETRALPCDAIDIIRIAAGDAAITAAAQAATRLSVADLSETAGLLLHHLLFFDGADSYRTLGVPADAEPSQIKQHYRWLVRWLHPDRDPDNAHSVFADRINRAWNSLRNDERRASYDRTLSTETDIPFETTEIVDTSTVLRHWAQPTFAPLLSGRTIRRLPQIIAIGGAIVAISALGVTVWLYAVDAARYEPAVFEIGPGTALAEQRAVEPATSATVSSPLSSTPSTPESPFVTRSYAGIVESTATVRAPVLLPVSQGSADAYSDAPLARREQIPVPSPPTAISLPTTGAHAAYGTMKAAGASADAKRIASRPAIAVTQRESDSPPMPSEAEIADFLRRFQRLYAANDVDEFLALFSAEAQGNDGGGLADIEKDYRRLFAQRKLRQLSLSGMRWHFADAVAVGNGSYEAFIGSDGSLREKRTRGTILIGLRHEATGLHITQLRHVVSE